MPKRLPLNKRGKRRNIDVTRSVARKRQKLD
jgi:hypothetical protein